MLWKKKIFAKRTALLICLTFLPYEFEVKSDLGCMYVEETAANVGLIEIWIYAVVKKNHTIQCSSDVSRHMKEVCVRDNCHMSENGFKKDEGGTKVGEYKNATSYFPHIFPHAY